MYFCTAEWVRGSLYVYYRHQTPYLQMCTEWNVGTCLRNVWRGKPYSNACDQGHLKDTYTQDMLPLKWYALAFAAKALPRTKKRSCFSRGIVGKSLPIWVNPVRRRGVVHEGEEAKNSFYLVTSFTLVWTTMEPSVGNGNMPEGLWVHLVSAQGENLPSYMKNFRLTDFVSCLPNNFHLTCLLWIFKSRLFPPLLIQQQGEFGDRLFCEEPHGFQGNCTLTRSLPLIFFLSLNEIRTGLFSVCCL